MRIGKFLIAFVTILSISYFSPTLINAEENAENEAEQLIEPLSEDLTDLNTKQPTSNESQDEIETEAANESTNEDETEIENDIDENGNEANSELEDEIDPSNGTDEKEDATEDIDVEEDGTADESENSTDVEEEPDTVEDPNTEAEDDTEKPEAEVKEDKAETPKSQKSVKMSTTSTNGFKEGDSSKDIAAFKKKLNKIGFGGIKVTDFYGDFTTRRIKEFQTEYGLKVTGNADRSTLAKIDEIYNSPIQLGKRHNDLISLKHKLNHLGFGNIKVTNYFGDFTDKKVRQFQSNYKLPISGIIDTKTQQYIHDIFSSTYEQGGRNEKIKDLKRNLNKIGFGGIKVTDLYGSFTETRVKQFQEYYGLQATGKADLDTILKANEIAKSSFQQGKRHKDTITLKNKLNKIGFGKIKVTNLYGSFTKKKVKEFQQFYGLKTNGIADDRTIAKINEIYNSPLQLGKRNNDLNDLKQMLNNLGYGRITVTNYFGDFAEKKVKQFQKDNNLPVSGIIDDVTRQQLENRLTSTYKLGGRNEKIKDLKRHLNKIGFGGIKVTDLYGSFTETRVKQFQEYYGLKVTGNADLETILKAESIAKSPYQQGKRHKNTITLKNNLNSLGFGNILVTDLYGSFTVKKVKDFQKYYGLKVNGIADEPTFAKVKEILNSPLQLGKSSNEIETLKKNLNTLGYSGIKVTPYFGDFTKKRLKEFQKDHGLPVSGIAEANTLAKIAAALKNNEKPNIITSYTDYRLTLSAALDIQMGRPIIITDKYRNDPAYVSMKYLKIVGPGKVTGSTVNVRTTASTSSSVAFSWPANTPITITGSTSGTSVSGSTLWYEITHNGKKYYVHSSLATGSQAEATATVNVRAGQGTSHHIFGQLKKGDKVTIKNPGTTWSEITFGPWRNPTRADMQAYLDPSKNDQFQHLRLDTISGATANELNKVLQGNGVLSGQGQAFINGAKKHNINEAYLVSHAFLETGRGTSTLANGVEVGKDKNGNLVLVTANNRSSLTAIKTTYNMFGIGAADQCPLSCGAITAYENGWFTPTAAIEGGAAWIGKGYIFNEHKQNTLYKMKWNPRMSEGYAWKQYATDIAWAVKQTVQIKAIYDQLSNPSFHYDIPTYY